MRRASEDDYESALEKELDYPSQRWSSGNISLQSSLAVPDFLKTTNSVLRIVFAFVVSAICALMAQASFIDALALFWNGRVEYLFWLRSFSFLWLTCLSVLLVLYAFIKIRRRQRWKAGERQQAEENAKLPPFERRFH